MIKDKIKQNVSETFKLLWQFKWSVSVYLIFYYALIREYFNPPEKDSPIWGSEAMRGSWNYINQEVYIGSMWDALVIFLLLFLIGTSNMRNHPLLAKCIFLYPLIGIVLGLLVIIVKWMLNLV
jgi:hypothetical protein